MNQINPLEKLSTDQVEELNRALNPRVSNSLDGLVVCECASDECPDYCRHKTPHLALKEQDYCEICTESSLCMVKCKDTKCIAHNAQINRPEKAKEKRDEIYH